MSMKEIKEKNKKMLLGHKSKVTNIIKQCFEYELEDEVPFKAKYDYRMFLENYYQQKFNEMIEIGKEFICIIIFSKGNGTY